MGGGERDDVRVGEGYVRVGEGVRAVGGWVGERNEVRSM